MNRDQWRIGNYLRFVLNFMVEHTGKLDQQPGLIDKAQRSRGRGESLPPNQKLYLVVTAWKMRFKTTMRKR